MTPDEFSKVQEISRLLKEAYDHYFEYEGHCKSAEGHITIDYGNLWDRENPYDLKVRGIEIYSYVFCVEARAQYFESIDEALDTVRGWHKAEMEYDYNSPEAIENRELEDKMAAEFLEEMMASGRLTIINVDLDDEEEGEGSYGVPI